MEISIAHVWWMLAVRGVLAIVFGVLAFLWPGLAWVVVVATFGAFAFVDGLFALASAFTGHRHGRQWGSLAIEGVIGILAGLITLFWPGVTQLALLFIIAYWAIATGIFEIAAAIRLRREIQGEWLLALGGVLSILFGLALVLMPVAGALAVAWLIGTYSLVFGVLMLALAFRLRDLAREMAPPPSMAVR